MDSEEYLVIDGHRLHWSKAARILKEASGQAQASGDAESAVHFLEQAALILEKRGGIGPALELAVEAEAIARQSYDVSLLADCLGTRAAILQRNENWPAALDVLREIETIERQVGSDKLEITLEVQFGIYYDLNDLPEMKRVAAEFFRVAKDAEAIWRIRRRLAHHGVKGGEEAAAAHPYDFGQTFVDRAEDTDQERIAHAQVEQDAGRYMLEGTELLKQGNCEGAVQIFDRAIALNSSLLPEAWWCKASAFGQLGRYEEEVYCCGQAIRVKKDYVQAMSTGAAGLIALDRFEEARDWCHMALALQPEFGPAHTNLGAALMGLERYDEARDAFLSAAKLGEARAAEGAAVCLARSRAQTEKKLSGGDSSADRGGCSNVNLANSCVNDVQDPVSYEDYKK